MLGSIPHLRTLAPSIKISDVARRYRLTLRAIRFYEQQGLISTSRGAQGHRLYDRQALDRLEFVVEARAVGLSLRELRALARSGAIDDAARRRGAILEACLKRRAELERMLAQVEAVILRQPNLVRSECG